MSRKIGINGINVKLPAMTYMVTAISYISHMCAYVCVCVCVCVCVLGLRANEYVYVCARACIFPFATWI